MSTASIITARMAQVARPGVIVSTIVTRDVGVETVTFTRDVTARLGFTTKVDRSRDEGDALAMQALAVAVAR